MENKSFTNWAKSKGMTVREAARFLHDNTDSTNEIVNELGKEHLSLLYPNVEHDDEGFREGGLTPYKAKKMLADRTDLTDKQRGYFGLIASGYKCGGMVKGYAQGGHVSPEEAKYKAAQKRYAELKQEESELSASKDKAAKSRLSDVRMERTALDKEFGFNNTGKSNIPFKSGADIEKALGTTGTKKKTTPEVMQQKPTELVTNSVDEEITPTGGEMITDTVTTTPVKTNANNNQNLLKGLGAATTALQGLGNYAIPFQQYKMGQRFLAETGKRPVDKIDPDFQSAVSRAQANAQYGYTPQEQSLLDQQNINALRAGQNAAQNYSGGSGAVAYNLSRDNANQYVSRGLKNLIGGKQLQMDKQAQADVLVGQKSEMNRRLFNDSMNAWTQNQQAGGNLVSSGLKNMLGAQRYNNELQFQNKYAQGSNPWNNYSINI